MRAQDEAEYAELVAAVSTRLFNTAYAVCHDRLVAEDAVQSALITAYLSWRRVRAADHPEAYLRRMVLNQLFSWRRRASWRAEQTRAELPEAGGGASHEDRVVEHDVVWQALAALPPRQRAVVVLRYYEDLSEAQIAEALGIRPGTVKSQTSAAMAHLRRELRDDVYARREERP